MAHIFIKDIVEEVEKVFPPNWQEDFDNSGMQVGEVSRPCTGVMLCVDVTPEIVIEAYERGCNLVIAHHPLIFHPLKRLTGYDRVTRTIFKAIRHDVAIYSCHTPIDNAPGGGVSWEMARMLSLSDVEPLECRGESGIGSGIIGNLAESMTPMQFVELVKERFDSPTARCSDPTRGHKSIRRVALCGGAGSFLIPSAIARGAQAFITSDCKHNYFLDYLGKIFLVDIGHYESEKCTKRIFYHIITEKFRNFAVYISEQEKNPVNYI